MSKYDKAARHALEGKNVVMFCGSGSERREGIRKTIEALQVMQRANKEWLCKQVKSNRSRCRIGVGNAYIRFELTRNGARGLRPDHAFFDDLAEYQAWFIRCCTNGGFQDYNEQEVSNNDRLR